MSWLHESPSHQPPWYWLDSINESLSSTRKDFQHLQHLCFEKCKYVFIFIKINAIQERIIYMFSWVILSTLCLQMQWCLANINTLRLRQNGCHFADNIFKCIFLNENVWISIKMSLKFVPKGLINNIPALVQIMAWRRPGDKPLSEAMMVNLPKHICVSRPQWVKRHNFILR